MVGNIVLNGTMLGMLMLASWIFCGAGKLKGHNVIGQMVTENNTAAGVRFAVFLVAFVLSFWQVIHPSGVSFQEDLNLLVKYGLLITSLLLVSQVVNDRLILAAFDNDKEVVGEKNIAVAVMEGATYLATAMILAGALAEFQSKPWIAMLWVVLGQAFLVVLYGVYRLFNSSVDYELDNHNLAVAFSAGGFLLAGGIMLGTAINGPSHGFWQDMWDVSIYVGIWLVFMGVAQFVADLLLVPGAKISDEVYKDKNPAVGMLSASVAIALTLFYTLVH